jgi:hypothetical protein
MRVATRSDHWGYSDEKKILIIMPLRNLITPMIEAVTSRVPTRLQSTFMISENTSPTAIAPFDDSLTDVEQDSAELQETVPIPSDNHGPNHRHHSSPRL